MKNVMLIAVISTAVLIGCSKEKLTENKESSSSCVDYQSVDFIPLTIGNYWVYDTYRIDTLGNETISNSGDSAYVDRDTIINGKTFYIIEGDLYAKQAIGNNIRNENNSILYYNTSDNFEKIVFTTNSIGTVYNQANIGNNLLQLTTWTNAGTQNITVDAGNYLCYQRETEVTPLVSGYPIGTRSQYRYYNSSVGVVINQFFFASSPELYETRLVSYNIN